jgi:hypothetical protein
LRYTLENIKPDIVVLDPFANCMIGDENRAEDSLGSAKKLANLIRWQNPECAILIVHHARTGASNIQEGTGWGPGNMMRGNKAILNFVRCAILLMPGSIDNTNKLVVKCAKSNNAESFKTRGVIFDPSTYEYKVDPDFNEQEWVRSVRSSSYNDACDIDDIVELVRSGTTAYKDIVDAMLKDDGCSEATVKRRLKEAIEKKVLFRTDTKGHYSLHEKPSVAA